MELTKEQVVKNIVDFMEQIAKEYVEYVDFQEYSLECNVHDKSSEASESIEMTISFCDYELVTCTAYLHGMDFQDYDDIVVNTISDELSNFDVEYYFNENLFENISYNFYDGYDLIWTIKKLYDIQKDLEQTATRIRNDFNSGKLYHKNKIKPKSELKTKIEQYLDSVGLPKNEIELDNNDYGYFTLVAKNGFDLVVSIDKNKNIAESASKTILEFEPEKVFDDLWERDYCREDGWTVKRVIDMLYDAKIEFDKKVLGCK